MVKKILCATEAKGVGEGEVLNSGFRRALGMSEAQIFRSQHSMHCSDIALHSMHCSDIALDLRYFKDKGEGQPGRRLILLFD